METNVRLKNLYLIAVITIGLIGLGIGSTFAMFTASAIINNPITFNSNLSSSNLLTETIEVTVPAYSDKLVDLDISNVSTESLYYAAWYSSSSPFIEVAAATLNENYGASGELPSETSFILTNTLRNRTSSPIVVTLGVISSLSNSLTVPSGTTLITLDTLPPLINQNAATYITDLYLNNKDNGTVTNNLVNYRRASSKKLMSDKLGESDLTYSNLDGGNVRYYGATPDNYVYFNCTDYLYQDDNTCELWRIIGVFDGKLKLIRSTSIGNLSWDTSASSSNGGKGLNDWTQSDLMMILNPGYDNNSIGNDIFVNNSLYWNRTSGAVNYFSGQNDAYTSLSDPNTMFYNTGITEATKTRNIIENTTWGLGPIDLLDLNVTPATAYKDERETTTWTGKVGVMYSSDYAYATDFSSCNRLISNYDNDSCRNNDWLYLGSDEWSFTKVGSSSVVYISSAGTQEKTDAYNAKAVRPVVFIESDEYIWRGTGTDADPYRIR